MHSMRMRYFVLKPRAKSRTDAFARASQSAMLAYADSIERDDPALADALRLWAGSEEVRMEFLGSSA